MNRLIYFIFFLCGAPINVYGGEYPNSEKVAVVDAKLKEDKSKQKTWSSLFTFSGLERSGVYTIDPHVWVYTRDFAERFGMPKEWISSELQGVDAAAWRIAKTGYMTCGWGRKKDACKEDAFAILELYFDARNVKLPWADWSRESDMLATTHWGNSQRFLVPQECEVRRDNSESPVGDMGVKCESRIAKQPLADPINGEEIFLFYKGASFDNQGRFCPIYAYDKHAYSRLEWIQLPYKRPTGLASSYGDVKITLETRTAPLGKTKKLFHAIMLPADFDRRIKLALDAEGVVERDFFKKILDIK